MLDSKSHRRFLLENAKYIASKCDDRLSRVIIAKDLTPDQRKERREKIVARKQQQGQNTANRQRPTLQTTPARQFPLSNPDVVEMQTEQQTPSPIRRIDGIQQTHYNVLQDSNLQNNSLYEQSTVVNIPDETTIMGGILTQEATSPNHPGIFEA